MCNMQGIYVHRPIPVLSPSGKNPLKSMPYGDRTDIVQRPDDYSNIGRYLSGLRPAPGRWQYGRRTILKENISQKIVRAPSDSCKHRPVAVRRHELGDGPKNRPVAVQL